MSFPREEFSQILADWLTTQLAAVCNGFGFEKMPPITDEGQGFGVVYSILGGDYDLTGPYEEYGSNCSMLYQVTSASRLGATQAEFLADRVRALMFALPNGSPAVPAPQGWTVIGVGPTRGPGGLTGRGDDPLTVDPNRVYQVPEDFVLTVSR